MEQELKENFDTFNCLFCQHKAHLPVLTRCGHLFCWSCFHNQSLQQGRCSICKQVVSREDVYPLFIQNQQPEADEVQLPERPLPENKPKILNADIISSRTEQSRNNIIMGYPFAGSLFMPGLGITTWSHIGNIKDESPERSISSCLKIIFICIMVIAVIAFGVQLIA